MSDTTSKPSGQEAKGIPQGVVDEVAALAADVTAMQRRAARGWKITAAVWIILLAVIASYLYILVYKPLKESLEPEAIVQLGISTLNGALAPYGVPGIDSPQLGTWAAKRLKDAAPGVMRDQVKPQLDRLTARLPEIRKDLTQRFQQEAPVWINDAVDQFTSQVLPKANLALLELVDEQTDELLAQLGTQVDDIVGQVIADSRDSLQALGADTGNIAPLRGRLEGAFEEAMGPVLDELLDDLDVKVRDVGLKIEELVEKYKAGRLSTKEKLEIRLMQLTMGLFAGAADEIPTGGGLLEELGKVLRDAGLPTLERETVIREVEAGRPVDLETMLKEVPEEYREEARKVFEESAARYRERRGEAPPAQP